MKKIIFGLMLVLVSFQLSAASFVECAPELRTMVNKIQSLPEAVHLIDTVQKEGPIKIRINTHLTKQFGAFWDSQNRVIMVNVPNSTNDVEGTMIGSIIFELHNALVSSKMDHLDDLAVAGKIGREDYVRSMEYLEYENSLKASAITEKGIRAGIFSEGAYLPTYSNFEEHYRVQRFGGHSSWIENNYNQITGR